MVSIRFFKEILTTLAVGACLGGSVLAVSAWLRLPIPEPHQRPVFFVGVVVFSIAFRLLLQLRDESLNKRRGG